MFQLSRVVIVRIQSNDTSRGLESTNRVAAAGTQGPHTSRRLVFPPLSSALSPSPRPNNGRAYIREYLITRVVSIQFLCTSDHHRSLPLVRRFRESDALTRFHSQLIYVYLQTNRSHERKGKINFCIVEEPCRRN